jgi:HEAT repeat protein
VRFHGEIRAAIPALVNLLTDHNESVLTEATSALVKLAEHGEPEQNLVERQIIQYKGELHDAIRPTIPMLTPLLTDQDLNVRSGATSVLAKLDRRQGN